MAISINTTYPGKVNAPSADYPQGSIKNETVPNSSDDGTPLDELWGDDFEGLKQAVMRSSGQSPTAPGNVPETALVSQIMRGIVELASGRAKNYDESGIADVYVFDVQANQQPPEELFDNLEASAYIVNTNTGASTVDVAGLGAKSIKTKAGADPAAGDLAAGDYLGLRFDQANDWWIIETGSQIAQATQSAIENETNEDTYIPPDMLKFHSGVSKAWVYFDGSIATPVPIVARHVTTITDVGTGHYTVNMDQAMSSANFLTFANGKNVANDNDSTFHFNSRPISTTTFKVYCASGSGLGDSAIVMGAAWGDQ